MQHRFILQPYKGLNTRFRCPNCQHNSKTFVRYIDTETNQHIHDNVGRCNREDKCGYHFTPKQYFQKNGIIQINSSVNTYKPKPQLPKSFIQYDIFVKTLQGYPQNNFVQFLVKTFGIKIANSILSKFLIGTSKLWQGATVFWQIDNLGKIRTGKIMLYNTNSGKRVKEPYAHINWVHSALKLPNYNLNQCLFGLHQLNNNNHNQVAIVESEKTAIIASIYLPQFIWLAVGSLTNLNEEKCRALKGRKVVLFPDLNAFDKWNCQAKTLKHITSFQVSNLLEINASNEDRQNGLDLADYLLRFPLQNFQVKQDVNDEKTIDVNEFSASFDSWWAANPQGGIFQYREHKFKVNPIRIL